MKKIVLSFLSVVAVTSLLQAQSFKFGIKAGANLSKIDGVTFQDGYKLAYHAGGFVELDLIGKLGVQPELLFSQTSSTSASGTSAVLSGINQNIDLNLQYLSIPVLLRYNVNKLVTLHLGPQYSILLSKNKTLLQSGQDAFKGGDFSAVGGLQINVSSLRVYGRYVIGLSGINDLQSQDKWKTQQLQVGVGLQL